MLTCFLCKLLFKIINKWWGRGKDWVFTCKESGTSCQESLRLQNSTVIPQYLLLLLPVKTIEIMLSQQNIWAPEVIWREKWELHIGAHRGEEFPCIGGTDTDTSHPHPHQLQSTSQCPALTRSRPKGTWFIRNHNVTLE